MKIGVVGTGYVGLVSGACFSEFGFNVVCMDKNPRRIEDLNKGIIPIYEPGLDSLVLDNYKKNRLDFSTDIKDAVVESDIVMIAVGTPTSHDDGAADLTYVFEAAKDVAKHLTSYTVVVTKSTVPLGTSHKIKDIIEKERPDLKVGVDFDVASNPEFLREGSAISDFMRPDRVVIGVDNERSEKILRQLYRPLYLIETPIVVTDIKTSELSKYASNGFLAVKIGFINQMADICEQAGANVQDIAKAMGLDGRIGRKFLHAGPGYGGSCFPKDTLALAKTAKDLGTPSTIIESVITSNDERKLGMVDRIITHCPHAKKIAILGITFKPNTDDLRDAPSLVIVPKLLSHGIDVQIYDPLYYKGCERELPFNDPKVSFYQNAYDAIHGCDGVAILTEWNEFRSLDLEHVQTLLNQKFFFDFRNIYKPDEMVGFHYYSIGRTFLKGNHIVQ
jgi:UDPglucose 6-dehydrogenase